MRLYELTDRDFPENLLFYRNIFLPQVYGVFNPQPKSDREKGESLHDYLTRKNIKCFCKPCRAAEEKVNNVRLV